MVFVDDFAHHPTAIRETVEAARERWPERRLLVAFEPRSNTTVTNRFQGELAAAFASADRVYIGPVHRADSVPEGERLDLARLVRDIGEKARSVPDADALAALWDAEGEAGDLVLICSNGAFGGLYKKVRDRIR